MIHLRLHYCSIHHQPSFKRFNELVSLELYEVTISSEFLESLIYCSPLLEKLVLQISSILNHIQIDASKLRSFEFKGSIESISLKNMPLLVKFSFIETSVHARSHDLAKCLESLPALEHLHLNYFQIKHVALDRLVNPVPDDFLTEIPASFSDVTLNHLTAVQIEGITGTRPQMQFIKILLAKSPKMGRTAIQPRLGKESPEARHKVLGEMIKFLRASPKVDVGYRTNPV